MTIQTPFKYIELFAGIGGFRQALDNLGGDCVFASEIDRFATQSYNALYGDNAHLHGDITQIDAVDVPDHDVLVGGFPCQAFSVAGKRQGFADKTRGTLFFDVVRIAAEKQPRMVVLENVKGLVGHDKGRTLDTIVEALNAAGYHVDFNVLNSKYFGVPQNRERIFIVALRDDLTQCEPWHIEGTNVVAKGKRRIAGYGEAKTFNFDWPAQTDVTTRLRDVLEAQVAEKYYLSEKKTAALVAKLESTTTIEEDSDPLVAGSLGHYGNDQMNRVYHTEGIAPTITVVSGGGREQKIAEPQMVGHINASGNDICKRVYSANGVAPTVPTGTSGNTTPKVATDIYPIINNRGAIERREDGISTCLDANYGKGIDNHGQRTMLAEAPRYRIRKLTPLECWRLQGFPDAAHDAVKDAGVSDSQRYKQAGNAVTVNVIEALGVRLLPFLGGVAESTERLGKL